MGSVELLEKAKERATALGACGDLAAFMSICTWPSLTVAEWSFGSAGVSVGRAEEKDHSSSSLEVAGAGAAAAIGCGWGVAGLDPNWEDARAANGSAGLAVVLGGGCPKPERAWGWGVFD